MHEATKKYSDLLIQKRYIANTLKTYCNYFKDFCAYFIDEKLENVTKGKINSYILRMIKEKYKQLCLAFRFGGINTIRFTQSLSQFE